MPSRGLGKPLRKESLTGAGTPQQPAFCDLFFPYPGISEWENGDFFGPPGHLHPSGCAGPRHFSTAGTDHFRFPSPSALPVFHFSP